MTAGQLDELAARVADRLRSMSLTRLARGAADDAHSAAQLLADIAADAEGLPRRQLPRLGDETLGDQVAVVSHDLLRADPPDEEVRRALDILTGLQRSL